MTDCSIESMHTSRLSHLIQGLWTAELHSTFLSYHKRGFGTFMHEKQHKLQIVLYITMYEKHPHCTQLQGVQRKQYKYLCHISGWYVSGSSVYSYTHHHHTLASEAIQFRIATQCSHNRSMHVPGVYATKGTCIYTSELINEADMYIIYVSIPKLLVQYIWVCVLILCYMCMYYTIW